MKRLSPGLLAILTYCAGHGVEAEMPWLSDNVDEVCGAIAVLTRQDTDEARFILISLSFHGEPAVRADAAAAFADKPWSNALPRLMDMAAHDPDASPRACAAMAIGASRDPRGLPALRTALADGTSRVRMRAAMALQEFDDMESVTGLLRALADDDGEVVFPAIVALGRRKGEDIVRALLPLLEHPQRKVRVATAMSLGRIAGRKGLADDPLLQTVEGGAELRRRWEASRATNAVGAAMSSPPAAPRDE